jgi:glycosyltransferase involved in cell wall biosynthesis
MRVLFCSLEAPLPPTNGLRLQVGALVGELRKRHEVLLLGYLMAEQESPAVAEGIRLVPVSGGGTSGIARPLAALLRGRPPGVEELAAGMRTALHEEMARFRPDVVHVTSGRLAALAGDLGGRAAVLAALDAWHLNVAAEAAASGWLRRASLLGLAWLVRRFEATEYRRFSKVVVVSDRDRRELERLDPSLSVRVIPNGVDLESFEHDGSRRDPDRIVFTGVMSYAPNVTAAVFLARRVFPRVRAVRPSARLAIVGRDPRPEVISLGELEGVEVHPEAPDLRPWLSGSRAFACPMRTGTGIKNKLLEAMANGLPCVATPLALQGLRAVPGEHVLVGGDEAAIAGHLAHILDDDLAADSLGRAGHEYVRSHHSWSAVADAYDLVYAEAIAGTVGGSPGTRPPSSA